jgi:hypothetical protein
MCTVLDSKRIPSISAVCTRTFRCVLVWVEITHLTILFVSFFFYPYYSCLDRYSYNDKAVYEGEVLTGMTGKAIPMMLVGDEKIRQQQALGKLTTASLRECKVSTVNTDTLIGLCPKLREIDLRSNLISSWST